jgi:cytochrome c oxidase subunit 3
VNRSVTARVGLAIFLGALAMLFAALLLAYAVMRAQAPGWPPPGTPPLPRGILGLNTLVLVASSVVLRAGLRARGDRRGAVAGALALGAAFLVAQALVWRALVRAGLGPASGPYGSVFFALSGLHALHLAGGLLALGAVGLAAPSDARLRLAATYWDFVLGVWVVLYLAVCLR